MQRNMYFQMKYWVMYMSPLNLGQVYRSIARPAFTKYLGEDWIKFLRKDRPWNTTLSFEIDNKSVKYLSRERALVLTMSPQPI